VRTHSVRTLSHAQLSVDELAAYGPLIGVIRPRLEDGEEVARFVVHGSDLLAFTDRRIVAARRGLFDYSYRRPRIRSISYNGIREVAVERVGQSVGQLCVRLAGRRRPVRLYFQGRLADDLADFVAAQMRRRVPSPT